jgi:hypothetical protein
MAAIFLEKDEIIVKPFEAGKLAELIREKMITRKPAAWMEKETVAAILQRCLQAVYVFPELTLDLKKTTPATAPTTARGAVLPFAARVGGLEGRKHGAVKKPVVAQFDQREGSSDRSSTHGEMF